MKTFRLLLIAITVLCSLTFIQTCGIRGKIKENHKQIQKLEFTVDSLNSVILGKPNIEEVRHEMEQTMYDFLLYEGDLDKGKISLSEIKTRIEK